jgi:hypothetical protein
MTVQARKTYRKLSTEMLYDEIRDLLSLHGLQVDDNRVQTYGVPSGATQSRVAATITTKNHKVCGNVHVIGSAGGDARMTIDLDESLVSVDTTEALKADIDFMLGAYEVRW